MPNSGAGGAFTVRNDGFWTPSAKTAHPNTPGGFVFDASIVARAGDVTHGKLKGVNFIIKY